MRRQVLALVLAGCGVAAGAFVVTPAAQGSYSGDADFRNYCASCHGAKGKGDGPIASSMRKQPTDLTQLAKSKGGKFPADQVFAMIDGRTPVAGHGSKDMPVWGDVFAQSKESPSADAVKARISELVRYIERMQEK